MLEVNDFNAIRISLASPEQILSWSYGEVTKPETINYRTLRPEKDGLFDERIFGPTKDWECYCGKYKRVRYKGIVCDKCGVEVTRSKVRRERMGHIELASPVSHIWFFKGTPSRMGLLLDISPRNLEKILYFATYVITHVDEEARQKALAELEADIQARHNQLEAEFQQKAAQLEARRDQELAEIEARRQQALEDVQARVAARREELAREADALTARLRELLDQEAPEDLVFSAMSRPLVAAGELVSSRHLELLREEVRQAIEAEEQRGRDESESLNAAFDREAEQVRERIAAEIEHERAVMYQQMDEYERSREDRRQALQRLAKMQLINELEYRDLQEKCPGVFKAGMGAEAVLELIRSINLDELAAQLRQELNSTSSQRRKKAIKRLKVVEAFRRSGVSPEWMILRVLPVLPPDLRPMVQLDGGRFATSDLNDLYRRVINRNNRLKRLLELNAPEIIIRNEKRMLQEAVDALIDNGRRGRAVAGTSNHKLKSLSDMLRGKQGRFRQNLLGKRVDYSGRSVIVVGPELKLHQCGLPKKMALELLKPFVMRKLVEKGEAPNIKSAKRIVERARPVVWRILEEVVKDHPVLLNRAPTLHRLGIQAFEVVLVDGSAIQIHPLVCPAFNADFDGDQMAVHVPLSRAAIQEARELMMATKNLLLPADGSPIVSPTKDMVLGCYYLTEERPGAKGEGKVFADFDEAVLAYDLGIVDLQARIKLRVNEHEIPNDPQHPVGSIIETTVGRIIFNQSLPKSLRFVNRRMDKNSLRDLISECFTREGGDVTAQVVDEIKRLGFGYATRSGVTMGIWDLVVPPTKQAILAEADRKMEEIERQYRRGLITEEEKYSSTVEVWQAANTQLSADVEEYLPRFGPVYMMAASGAAKGNFSQIRQITGMRGLMADPAGNIIALPIRSNFREGLSVIEYFISTHGARKGLADTALRTADSGYLTRRLIDVAQDVIVNEEDCGTTQGITLVEASSKEIPETAGTYTLPDGTVVPRYLIAFDIPLGKRVLGRVALEPIINPETGEVIVQANEEIDERAAAEIDRLKIKMVRIRSPLTCEARYGVCVKCYGRDLCRGKMVELGTAVGIIAAQSIGEPGTQLTMRTFHTGGVAGEDITSGLPRVEELFEARVPKGAGVIATIDGKVEVIRTEQGTRVKVVNVQELTEEVPVPAGYRLLVSDGDEVAEGAVLAERIAPVAAGEGEALPVPAEGDRLVAPLPGFVEVRDGMIVIHSRVQDEAEYPIPHAAHLRVKDGDFVVAGEQLTDGPVNPKDILRVLGRDAVQQYLVNEVQKVYRGQGVSINDKHIEVIVRQMLRRVLIDSPGDTDMLPEDLVDRFAYTEANERVVAEGGEPATAHTVLLGVTKASFASDSFLAAASFQETTRVLTEAAIEGKKDLLRDLKSNVIIGKLIPAGTGFKRRYEQMQARRLLAGGPEAAQALPNPAGSSAPTGVLDILEGE